MPLINDVSHSSLARCDKHRSAQITEFCLNLGSELHSKTRNNNLKLVQIVCEGEVSPVHDILCKSVVSGDKNSHIQLSCRSSQLQLIKNEMFYVFFYNRLNELTVWVAPYKRFPVCEESEIGEQSKSTKVIHLCTQSTGYSLMTEANFCHSNK